MFKSFVDNGMKTTDQLQMFVLQYMFMPRINEDLLRFKEAWNNHKLSSAKNMTPLQLIDSNRNLFPPHVNVEDDDAGEDINADEAVPQVVVEPLRCPLSAAQLLYFKNQCVPLGLGDEGDTLYDKYLSALEFAYLVLNT